MVKFVKELSVRYAKALFALANQAGIVEQVDRDLKSLADLVQALPILTKFVNSPIPDKQELTQALILIKRHLSLSDLVTNFCHTLIHNSRLPILLQCISQYHDMVLDQKQTIKAEVTSAISLQTEQLDIITELLTKKLNKKVLLSAEVDQAILGGYILQIGSLRIDDSLQSKLTKVKAVIGAAFKETYYN